MTAGPDNVERLRSALMSEHAALYAYGRIGVHLNDAGRAEARAAEVAHRGRRDALVVHLDQVKASPAPADAGYTLPFPVIDETSALMLAEYVENGVTANWRSVLAATENELRRLAIDGYSDAAVRATRWRKIAGQSPLRTAFPGRPG
ncbi:hypothetical protein Rhe02_40700 [Rhizocola hellebori]|uniref:DUF4439 domain-containing protein n=1 Tax=Rhizocola hellebori TaxID=1392758 RepID=A0A8J3Q8A5_9ACTN|nr:ferritin-like domain-containing protein [Rhizocola hellebori]GIH06003.1 hypothetical protein Rhe02_40700 [Rhizocola hellebori]